MREILFRGKQIDTGAWVEGAFCMKDCDDPFGKLVDRPSIIKYEPPHDGYWFRVDPETVGQYTGLTDKNGQKIFEGDIISGLGNTYVCRWDEGNVEFTVFDGKESFGLAYTAYPCMEVVGNIHDNPKLLEVSDVDED